MQFTLQPTELKSRKTDLGFPQFVCVCGCGGYAGETGSVCEQKLTDWYEMEKNLLKTRTAHTLNSVRV